MYEIIDNEIHKRLEKMKLLITNQGVTLFAIPDPLRLPTPSIRLHILKMLSKCYPWFGT